MSDNLFDIDETPSPELQWKELCKAAGVETWMANGEWFAAFPDPRCQETDDETGAKLPGYVSRGHDSEFDAIQSLNLLIARVTGKTPIFPLYSEWKFSQMKRK